MELYVEIDTDRMRAAFTAIGSRGCFKRCHPQDRDRSPLEGSGQCLPDRRSV